MASLLTHGMIRTISPTLAGRGGRPDCVVEVAGGWRHAARAERALPAAPGLRAGAGRARGRAGQGARAHEGRRGGPPAQAPCGAVEESSP